jgi:Ca2+-binding EF-hand superfamily protein
MANNPDGQLDKAEFVRLYTKLKSEPADKLDEIALHVFNAFDKDNNGKISFTEFMVAYALTSRGKYFFHFFL